MPENSFTVAEVLDRGLAAVPDVLVRLDEPDLASKADVTALVRDAFSSAAVSAEFHGLVSDVIAAADPLGTATVLIAGRYAALGGAAGVLGSTAGTVSGCPDGFGFYRHFKNGSIFWHPATGVHEMHGPIRAKWASLGWERSFLGYPTSDQLPGTDPEQLGTFNRFQGGAIHWHPEVAIITTPLVTAGAMLALAHTTITSVNDEGLEANTLMARISSIGDNAAVLVLGDRETVLGSSKGAYEVHGEIAAHYRALGGSGSFLGYPVTDETGTPDGIGRYNHFQAGSIYWTASTGAHEVHGLLRQLWAQRGWERDASLGYPITDELIPDRRIGHRRPETKRKPLDLPADVIKLPAEAMASGFSPLVSNVGPGALLRRPVSRPVNASALTDSAADRIHISESAADRVHLSESVAEHAEHTHLTDPSVSDGGIATPIGAVVGVFDGIAGGLGQSSTPAPVASLNRYGDFESGVLYWARGAGTARVLQPWPQTATGESMHRSAAEVIAAMEPTLRQALGRLSGATYAGLTFVGTTPYSFDGANVHNRRHRAAAQLMTTQHIGGIFGSVISVPMVVRVDLLLEMAFEPTERRVSVCLADWSFSLPSAVEASPPLDRQLHPLLDALLFKQVALITLPDTDAGRPIAVLSAKTMPDGAVTLFIEPADSPQIIGEIHSPLIAIPH